MRNRLLAAAPVVATTLALLDAFRALVRTREGSTLAPSFTAAEACVVPEIRSFAASLRRDEAAVAAGLTLPWSSGAVEGHVNRTKLIKRQMYGRATFALLRRRVLLVS
jgi:transposase